MDDDDDDFGFMPPWARFGGPAFGGGGGAMMAHMMGRGSGRGVGRGPGSHAYRFAPPGGGGGPPAGGFPTALAFSDRDFGPDDYEQLLALDERSVVKRGTSRRELESHSAITVLPPSRQVVFDLTRDDGIASPSAAAAAAGEEAPRECAICLELPSAGQCVRRLRCLHAFHVVCIDTWLDSSRTCPICKMPVAPASPETGPSRGRGAGPAGGSRGRQ